MELDTQESTSTRLASLHRNYSRPTARLVRNYEFETLISATKNARVWVPGQAADVVVPMLQGA